MIYRKCYYLYFKCNKSKFQKDTFLTAKYCILMVYKIFIRLAIVTCNLESSIL